MTCVAIIGSTEEGAVDPILGLYHLRQQFRMRVNYSSYVLVCFSCPFINNFFSFLLLFVNLECNKISSNLGIVYKILPENYLKIALNKV